ncbi:MAG TPA: hypothetical protein VMR45_04140 [Patescibacteria group bacterium]|nr:hypothetical protein [Patescibacteria group bacterium]
MLGSRRLLVVGLIIVGALLIGVLTVALKKSDPYRSACDKFIGYVMKQDSTSSYNMLSASARANATQDQWKSSVISLTNVYRQAKLQFVSKSTITQPNGDSTQTRTLMKYTVKNPAATSNVTCYVLSGNNKTYAVDGFQSVIE